MLRIALASGIVFALPVYKLIAAMRLLCYETGNFAYFKDPYYPDFDRQLVYQLILKFVK